MGFTKRGQAWAFDLVIASVIFVTGIVLFFIYSLNLSDQGEESISKLTYQANSAANNLLSDGTPKDWVGANVEKIGLLSDGKINETKLERFYDLSEINYDKSRILLGVQNNYYIFFQEKMMLEGKDVEGIGLIPTNPKNLIKISRVTIYKDKPTAINIEVWE